jgi:ankyrin repeat protein
MVCNNGEAAMLRALLQSQCCDVLLCSSDNSNALHYSARNHHHVCTAMLLEHCTPAQRETLLAGADREGYTPLHSAVMNKANQGPSW